MAQENLVFSTKKFLNHSRCASQRLQNDKKVILQSLQELDSLTPTPEQLYFVMLGIELKSYDRNSNTRVSSRNGRLA
ncbi:hypothetical protein Dsin_000431 [Dipteronia sinensis]|uniref:Uncharacterized protein n=1 Tax=Dipteronia sinensis TaxID=43782 RepID=A0AAE0EJD6_9ROSI|nr:hypothetical protein Dsin_000431 [Dipteronia sinensis]